VALVNGTTNASPEEPWVRVVNVTNVDHIYVSYNYAGVLSGKSAGVFYSLDGGANWNGTVLEKTTPGGGRDSPAVRSALSGDGRTVYMLFQRVTSWLGTPGASDYFGDVVLMRDDAYGGSGYGGLGGGSGTLVSSGTILAGAGGTSLGQQQLGSGIDVAINPGRPSQVYVAYTEVSSNAPMLRVQSSTNSGASFSLAYSIKNASLPALAVAKDGTVGLLYALLNGNSFEVHFLKAFGGRFASLSDRTLARFPNNQPGAVFDPYVGRYFSLRAVGYNFFGAFSASNDPQPSHFPSGVFYQRAVRVGGTVKNYSWLSSPGTLDDGSGNGLPGNSVAPSIDPFAFYDIAPSFIRAPLVGLEPSAMPAGGSKLSWPVMPTNEPQFQLQASAALGNDVGWNTVTGLMVLRTDGQFEAPLGGNEPQQFFRLGQDVRSGLFPLFSAAGAGGVISPQGVVQTAGTANQSFTASPGTFIAGLQWHFDGELLSGYTDQSLRVSDITTEHTLVASFMPSNDLAVTLRPTDPCINKNTNTYWINIQNEGVNPLTGITLSDQLPNSVSLISAMTSQGSVSASGNLVTGNLGSLSPGASAMVSLQFVPMGLGGIAITDVVNVACDQVEQNLANNSAMGVTTVIDPVTITTQPMSQTVPSGTNVTFSAGISGTGPFAYQWFFNGAVLSGYTAEPMIVSHVTSAQAGQYSVTVSQVLGPSKIVPVSSAPATLTVSP
jgi:uncharacterized repeat protein (TIGR01451 family)